MIYAMTDTTSVTVPVERGGCGSPHDVNRETPGERGTLTCPTCEPHLIGLNTGWAHHAHQVALTPDEIGEAEAREGEAKRMTARTWADPSAFAETMAKAMRGGDTTAAPSLLAQFAALSAEERAAFVAFVTATAPAVEAPARRPVEPDDDSELAPAATLSTGVDKGVDEPVRRGPGRPRRNP